MKKKLLEYFFGKRLQKSNQKRFRDKKVLKKKGDFILKGNFILSGMGTITCLSTRFLKNT